MYVIAACKSETRQNTLQFNVDQNLLGEKYTVDALDFAFSVPAGWAKMPDSIMTQAKVRLTGENPDQNLTMDLQAFYLDSLSGSFCSVSEVQILQGQTSAKDIYRQNLQKKYPQTGIKEGDFVINDVTVHQFLIVTDNKILFKLLLNLKGDSFFQIDYAIDQNIYPQYVTKIESSIGSITSTI